MSFPLTPSDRDGNRRLRRAQDALFLATGRRPRLAFNAGDGSRATAFEATFEVGGKFVNVPTLFRGEPIDPDAAFEMAARAGLRDPQTGDPLPLFNSESEAVEASKARSAARLTQGDQGMSFDPISGAINFGVAAPGSSASFRQNPTSSPLGALDQQFGLGRVSDVRNAGERGLRAEQIGQAIADLGAGLGAAFPGSGEVLTHGRLGNPFPQAPQLGQQFQGNTQQAALQLGLGGTSQGIRV